MPSPNAEQLDLWTNDSGVNWIEAADDRDRFLAGVADALFERAPLASGQRVLDLGCGCGTTSFMAAEQVGPSGAVVGLDFSPTMLSVARQRAEAQSGRRPSDGTAPVVFIEGDAQLFRLDEPCDIAISRFGTMFYDDPVAAFTTIAGNLVAGAPLCIATWQGLADNAWLAVPGAALAGFVDPSTSPDGAADAGPPMMFAQADPDEVRRVLSTAGFDDIALESRIVPLRMGDDPAAATEFLANTGPGRAALESIPEDRRDDARAALTAALVDHFTDDGVHLDGAIWIVTATRP